MPRRLLLVLLIGMVSGCATTPYRYGGDFHTDKDVAIKDGEPQLERGRPAPIIDGIGWIVGIPAKIVLLEGRADNHNVSLETEYQMQEYLAKNNLDKVKVRINEYDPCGEWHRLTANESVSCPLRYTVGALSVACYTILPGRIWGGDSYNPFTNTISIYSDVPAYALYQGGFAKEYAEKEWKGLNAVAYIVPGVGLWQEIQASNDAMSYINENGTSEEIKAGYRGICPVFAARAASPFGSCVSVGGVSVVEPAALVAGHAAGQTKAATIKEAPRQENVGSQPDVVQ